MSVGKFLTGVVLGAAIGGIAGVLLAPKSGEETRNDISDMAKNVAEKTDQTVKDIKEKADNIVSDMQTKGDEIMNKIQSLINKQKAEMESAE